MRLHKPFDTVTKDLLEADPLAWLHLAGLPGESVTLEDTNLATLSADADRVLRVDHTEPYVADIEFQASHKEDGNRQDPTAEAGGLRLDRKSYPVGSANC